MKFTRHGPVIYVDKENNRAFAVRTAWSEPGTSPYFVSVAVMRARTFAEYEKAVARWGKPALNFVYADTKGNIAWTPRGYAPIRPNWDGLLPVPGDGKYEWSGTWSGAQLPLIYNPPSGYLTTSNEMNLPRTIPTSRGSWASSGQILIGISGLTRSCRTSPRSRWKIRCACKMTSSPSPRAGCWLSSGH